MLKVPDYLVRLLEDWDRAKLAEKDEQIAVGLSIVEALA